MYRNRRPDDIIDDRQKASLGLMHITASDWRSIDVDFNTDPGRRMLESEESPKHLDHVLSQKK